MVSFIFESYFNLLFTHTHTHTFASCFLSNENLTLFFIAGLDGSVSSLIPVKDAVHKRLQLVQTRLIRHLPHFAGLNPRGFRFVFLLLLMVFLL